MSGPASSYKPEYCQQVIDCLAEGHSIKGFAGKIRKNKDTVFEWKKKYPEFAEAVEIGITAAVYKWEQRLIHLAETGEGNPASCIFGLKNRAADDWSDKVVNEHTGKDGGAVKHVVEVQFISAGET